MQVKYGPSTRQVRVKARVKSWSESPVVQDPLNAPGEAQSGAPEVEPRAGQRASHGSAISHTLRGSRVADRVPSVSIVDVLIQGCRGQGQPKAPEARRGLAPRAGHVLGVPVFAERGRKRPPPLARVDPHTTKRGVSVCPYFVTSISRCRLFSQDRELCFSRLRVKEARSRRQIQND